MTGFAKDIKIALSSFTKDIMIGRVVLRRIEDQTGSKDMGSKDNNNAVTYKSYKAIRLGN